MPADEHFNADELFGYVDGSLDRERTKQLEEATKEDEELRARLAFVGHLVETFEGTSVEGRWEPEPAAETALRENNRSPDHRSVPAPQRGALIALAACVLLAVGVFTWRPWEWGRPRGMPGLRDCDQVWAVGENGELQEFPTGLSAEDKRQAHKAMLASAIDIGRLPRGLRSKDRFMSGDYPYELFVAPVETVILSATPLFRWQAVRNAEQYEIDVYNASTSERIDGATVTDTQWRCSETLERGVTYRWKVTALAGKDEYVTQGEGPRFKVATDEVNAEARSIQRKYSSRSHLLLARKYVDLYLLDLAEGALMRLREEDSGSPIARNLIANLQRDRKSATFRFGE